MIVKVCTEALAKHVLRAPRNKSSRGKTTTALRHARDVLRLERPEDAAAAADTPGQLILTGSVRGEVHPAVPGQAPEPVRRPGGDDIEDADGTGVTGASAPHESDAAHLLWLREHPGDRFLACLVLHTGSRIHRYRPDMAAIPIACRWGTASG